MIDNKRKVALSALILKRIALYNNELTLKEFINSFSDLARNPEEELFIIKYVSENLSKSKNIIIEDGKVISRVARFTNHKIEQFNSSEIGTEIKSKINGGIDAVKTTTFNKLLTDIASATSLIDSRKSDIEDGYLYEFAKQTQESKKNIEQVDAFNNSIISELLRNSQNITERIEALRREINEEDSYIPLSNRNANEIKIDKKRKCKDCISFIVSESGNSKLPYKITCSELSRSTLIKAEEIDSIDDRYFGGCRTLKK